MCAARFAVAAFALLIPFTAVAQPAPPPVGRIAGVVTTDGLSLPGVTITARSPLGVRTTITNAFGGFVITGLPLGAVYEVTAELQSFRAQKRMVALTVPAASHDLTFELPIERLEPISIACDELSEREVPLSFSVTDAATRLLPIDRSLPSIVSLSPGVHGW